MDKILNKPIKDFMTKEVIAVQKDTPIKKVFQLLDKNGILGVPVVNEANHVIGMVTETDLVRHFTTLETPRSINLLGGIIYLDDPNEFNRHLKEHCAELTGDIMREEVTTIEENKGLHEAIDIMSNEDIGRLPVTNDNNELVGIISRSDIVHQLAKVKQM